MLFRSQTHITMANGNLRPRGTTQRKVRPLPFRDTVVTTLNTPSSEFDLNSLLPSLGSRTCVVDKIFVEVLPTILSDSAPLLVNSFLIPQDDTNAIVSTGTYKVVSAVNPTNLVIDVRALRDVAPSLLNPRDSAQNIPMLRIILDGLSTIDPQLVRARITTHISVFPQENLEQIVQI